MHTYIIAEAGVNHNGSIELAKQLIDEASNSGADAVKFQTFTAKKLVTKNANKADYQRNNEHTTDNQYDMLKKLELKIEDFAILKDYAEAKGIDFLTSAFDLDGIDLLKTLNIKLSKIPSGEITNLPYLRKIAKLNKPIILSTGMSTYSEIESALDVLRDNGAVEITVLHCNTEYPTPMEDVNLNAMISIRTAFNVRVGYSDHTEGITVPITAVALGASMIEKHFTLDRTMDGPDHAASLEPNELTNLVNSIRDVEIALGDGVKRLTNSEKLNIPIVRKSIVANTKINKGEYFTEDNITVKRPGNGISPMNWDSVIGEIAKKDFNEDDVITL